MKKLCTQARARLQIWHASIKVNTGNLQHFLRKCLEITSEGTSVNHLTLVPQGFGSSVRGAAASKGTPLTICCNLLAKMALGASVNSTLMVSKLSRRGLACCPDGSKISQPLGEADRFCAAVRWAIIFPHPFSKQHFAGLKKCNLRLGILPSPEPDFFPTQMRHICHPYESFGNGWLCQGCIPPNHQPQLETTSDSRE